jgi:hypothetical protein
MRSIFLIGINFVRSQWIALATLCAYVLGIGSIYRSHTQPDDVLFFLRWHATYAIFFAILMAVPVLQTERKSRRILAVLSKGIHRWQYMTGILCGCAIISVIFCLLIGGTAAWLGQQAGMEMYGLGEIILALFLCCVASASTALFFAAFLHPLLAMAATSIVLSVPLALQQSGLFISPGFFPAASLFRMLWAFQFQQAASGLETITFAALFQTLLFLIAACAVFARRDVTISPE